MAHYTARFHASKNSINTHTHTLGLHKINHFSWETQSFRHLGFYLATLLVGKSSLKVSAEGRAIECYEEKTDCKLSFVCINNHLIPHPIVNYEVNNSGK